MRLQFLLREANSLSVALCGHENTISSRWNFRAHGLGSWLYEVDACIRPYHQLNKYCWGKYGAVECWRQSKKVFRGVRAFSSWLRLEGVKPTPWNTELIVSKISGTLLWAFMGGAVVSEAWMSTSMPVNRVQGLASRTDKKMSAFLFLLFFLIEIVFKWDTWCVLCFESWHFESECGWSYIQNVPSID